MQDLGNTLLASVYTYGKTRRKLPLSGSFSYQLHAYKKSSLLTRCEVISLDTVSQVQSFGCFSLQYGFSCGRFEILRALNLKIKIFWVKAWSSSHRQTTNQRTTSHSRRKESKFDDVYLLCNGLMHTTFIPNWFQVFLHLLNYTKLLDVSTIHPGLRQGVRSHKIVTTYS
jgi:hypothetical protein